jgi:hypothetical protein
MRRWLITIVILLLAGVVANVTVAWAFAMFGDPYQSRTFTEFVFESEGDQFQFLERRCIGAASYWCRGQAYIFADDPPPNEKSSPNWLGSYQLYPHANSFLEARGWPLHSLSAGQDRVMGFPFEAHWGLQTTLKSFTFGGTAIPCVLPLRPIWPAFAVNSLFYTALVPAVWLLARRMYSLAFRRLIRRRRGLCPACAYPVGDSPICTECGRPLPKRAVA